MKKLISRLPQGTLLSSSQTSQLQLMISSELSGKESWDKSCWTELRHLSEHSRTVQYLTVPPLPFDVFYISDHVKKKDCSGVNVRFINKDSDNKLLYVFYRSALKKIGTVCCF